MGTGCRSAPSTAGQCGSAASGRLSEGQTTKKQHEHPEKRAPGWFGYIGHYTTQLYRDYNKLINHYKDPY